MASQQSNAQRARFVQQLRQNQGSYRDWFRLRRQAQATQVDANGNPIDRPGADPRQQGAIQSALRASMATPGPANVPPWWQAQRQPGGGPTASPYSAAPVQPATQNANPGPASPGPAPTYAAAPQSPVGGSYPPAGAPAAPLSPPQPAAIDWGAYYDANVSRDQIPTDPAAAAERRAVFIQNQTPDAIAAQAARNAQTSAYEQAKDYAVGVRPDMSTGGPISQDDAAARATRMTGSSEALQQFNASGYDGQRALADGWGNGQGATGWLTQAAPPAAPQAPSYAPPPAPPAAPQPNASAALANAITSANTNAVTNANASAQPATNAVSNANNAAPKPVAPQPIATTSGVQPRPFQPAAPARPRQTASVTQPATPAPPKPPAGPSNDDVTKALSSRSPTTPRAPQAY